MQHATTPGSRAIIRLLVPLVLMLMVPAFALAQGVTTSAISGSVIGDQGQPLGGVQIVVTNTATGATTGVLSRPDGRYLLPGLQPGGPYRIEARGIGYAPQAREGVTLALGQTARFDFAMVTAAVAIAGVEVTADRDAVISRNRTGTGSVVGQQTIERSPTITRDFTDFTRLVPQLSTSTPGTSAAGRNNRFNNIQIDGAVNNDLFGLAASGTPGGQAGTRPITLEAIQEFQVVLAPYDVRQGGFTGAGINAVTRSGTNDVSGTVAFFGRNQEFVGRYNLPAGGTSQDIAEFEQTDLAFSLGGPLVRDRAHFFFAGELTRRNAPSGFFIGTDGAAAIRPDTADLVSTILRNQYGFDGGTFGERTLRRQSDNVFGRIDVSINPQHRLTLRHNYVDAFDDNLGRSNSAFQLGGAGYVFNSTTNSSVAQLNSVFSQNLFNELRFGYTTVRDQRSIDAVFPRVHVDVPGGQLRAGPDNFSGANALDQDVLELTNDVTLALGRHTLTFGTRNEFFQFSNLFIRNPFGFYRFPNPDALVAGRPTEYEFSYVCEPGLPGCIQQGRERAEFGVSQHGFYLQNQWQAMDNLTLTGGLRFDVTRFADSPGHNPAVFNSAARRNGQQIDTDATPNQSGLFNPRLGVNWDVFGNNNTQVRGGIGLFSGRTPYVWISNAYGNTGLDLVRFRCVTGGSDPTGTPDFVADPNNQPRSCQPGSAVRLTPNEINTIDPEFRYPQVLRYSAAVDQRLPLGLIGTLEGLFNRTRHDVLYRELLVQDQVGSAEGRPRWSRQNLNAAGLGNIVDITNTDQGYTYSLTAQLQRPFADGWEASAAYTFGEAWDLTSVTSSQAFSNWQFNPIDVDPNNPRLRPANYDIRHRFIVTGSRSFEVRPRFATDISVVFVGESGRPYSYTYNGDVNADGSSGNDLIYVPRDARDVTEVRFNGSAEQQAAARENLETFIASVPCLDSARGTVLQRNACREPWNSRLDLRLAQSVPTFGGQNLQITLDVLNFGNMLNRDWGLQQFVNNLNDNRVAVASGGTTPDANGRVLLDHRNFSGTVAPQFQTADLSSRYQIQLGARYAF